MSKRAQRRADKRRAIARQIRILSYSYARWLGDGPHPRQDSRCLNYHINCNCMGQKDEPLARDQRKGADDDR